ncbi:MAG TPA: hypothetical protein VGS19_34825 [Streptosporangiaceae bacterium]|nr:hypothetical protein [Streptosporangiaceae bacterium]
MAAAHILDLRLDGAADALRPVLAMPPALRITQFGERLTGLRARLAGPEFAVAQEAIDLCEQIDEFCAETAAQQPRSSEDN